MSEDDSNTRVSNVIRWVLVLPAAVVCAVLVSFPVHWVVLSTFRMGAMIELSDAAAQNVERVAFAFFGPFAFVVAGTKVAPKHPFAVSVVLTCILLLWGVASFVFIAVSPSVTMKTPVRGSIGVVCALLGLVAALFVARSTSPQSQEPRL